MPAKLARASGVVAIGLSLVVAIIDIEVRDGGFGLPKAVHAFALTLIGVCAVLYCTHRIVAATPAPTVNTDEIREMIRAAVAGAAHDEQLIRTIAKEVAAEAVDQFAELLDEKVGEVYRVGMVSGAQHQARPHIVRAREGD